MTHFNVNLSDAHSAFVSYIAAAHSQQVELDVLEVVLQEKLDRLNQYMDILTRIATAGMEEQISPLLSTLLQEWSIKEAVELLLRYQGYDIDPSHPGLQQTFKEKLNRQHQALSSELFLQLQQGKQQRADAQAERASSWQAIASRAIENQQQQQQLWQNATMQWVQGQSQMNHQWFQHQQQLDQSWRGDYQQLQASNQQWANLAATGLQQGQLGLQQWYDFAAATQQNVVSLLSGTEQRQTQVVEAIRKANAPKWGIRIAVIVLILVGIVALFGCSFMVLLNLY